ncbi:cell wall hydrolase [Altererythrobacter halimionae]|uniref:Cell wall hydrolase n=2 Tax=Alteriqipengyuania halimionae TaxID=1926630 RepID=A0A6I4U8M0_9SPHN|nr:cell wall hydrolase [Alteriqipengyuania halimionae]
MTHKLKRAATIATAVSTLTLLFGADGSSAFARDNELAEAALAVKATEPTAPVAFVSNEVTQEIPADYEEEEAEVFDASSLGDLVAQQPHLTELSREMQCLAGAIYFESRGESLDGQLAVGRVIVGRAKSGRFPNSYCGVVYQRSQFSFVRGGRMPAIRYGSHAWKRAVAIAQIAHEGTWKSEVDGALFFHARYVNPRWRLTRLAQVGNHVFYK